ncbi:MAG: TRAP transporter large permease subunit [Proteobacteria bacterium]|nr:TRAP transporter large permease subunit [Pseudomonadota bacterium]MDA1023621.1 TRAP transporter large permease subunit [Pseudomonadota bacterium]
MELLFLALLIALMAYALGSGYPVAFALPGSAIISIGAAAFCGYLFEGNIDAYFAQGSAWQWLSAGVTNFRGVYWEVERDTLIAIPLFIFMGIMLQRSKLAEDLLVTMAQLFGPVPGGLGISVVFVGALLAATTGIVGATVVAMGLISLPVMMRNKYSNTLSTGTIAASGTLGQIIPPSIVLIILADQLSSAVDQASTARKGLYKVATGEFSMPSAFDVGSTSAGEMFLGAFVPGLTLVVLYMLYIMLLAIFRPDMAPSVRYAGKFDGKFFIKVAVTLIPPLALIFLVLGSIITGVATVNQAGAIGAAGALIMGGYRLREGHSGAYTPAFLALGALAAITVISTVFDINIKKVDTTRDVIGLVLAIISVAVLLVGLIWSGWRTLKIEDTLRGVMVETAKTTSLVFIILLGAAMLTAAFRAFGGEDLVRDFLTSMPGGFWVQFFIVMAVIFILGFFLDFIEIAVVVVPIVAPILLLDPAANVTAVWLGVMIGLNIQTSFLTPPFGFALFYLRGVAPPSVKTISMYKGVIPFILLQLLALVIVGYVPQLANYLPYRMALTSQTAPPPRNPGLQYCVEKYVFSEFARSGDKIRAAITAARALDLATLPAEMRSDLKGGFDKAEKTFDLIKAIDAAEKALDKYSVAYRPLHVEVREIQKAQARIKVDQKKLTTDLRQMSKDPTEDAKRDRLKSRLEELAAENKRLTQTIPSTWAGERKAFVKVKKADTLARRIYRRNVDAAYEALRETTKIIGSANELVALQGRFAKIKADIKGKSINDAQAILKELTGLVRRVPGASAIAKELSDARRALRNKNNGEEKALLKLIKAQDVFAQELSWRTSAAKAVLPGLETYEAAIRGTIGLRLQPRLPLEQAKTVAVCKANPYDLTLSF